MTNKVLSVGQCGADHGSISGLLRGEFGAEVSAADSLQEALTKAQGTEYQLILINRVLDRDGSPGLAVVRALKQDAATSNVPVMLVSNYADAQSEAVTEGALPGFGKSELRAPETRQKLQAVLG